MKQYGVSSTYKASDMCTAPATTTGFIDPGYIHDVLLIDLHPNTKYYFKYGSSEVSKLPFYLLNEPACVSEISNG